MPKRKKLAPWIFGDGPEPVSVELTVDQKRDITERVGIALSAQDWKTIEQARRDYTSWQWTKRQAVEHKHLEKRMKRRVNSPAIRQSGNAGLRYLPPLIHERAAATSQSCGKINRIDRRPKTVSLFALP
jgi:hypothetical protein